MTFPPLNKNAFFSSLSLLYGSLGEEMTFTSLVSVIGGISLYVKVGLPILPAEVERVTPFPFSFSLRQEGKSTFFAASPFLPG